MKTIAVWLSRALLIGGMMALVYIGFASSSQSAIGSNLRQTLGKTVFWSVAAMELLMVSFIAPALTAVAKRVETGDAGGP